MRGIQHSPDEPIWALPGRWDWSVKLSLVGTLALCGSMIFANGAANRAHRSDLRSAPCVPDARNIHRLVGPAAWTAVTECVVLSGRSPH